jgi:predicted glutamine amidotransferase
MFMSDLLTHSDQSLIMQSFRAREREEPLNGDGFGVGWYAPEIDPTPCVFTSVTPAWSNRNLRRLAEKTRSTSFFAHVRAASAGMAVNEANCHPFVHRQFLWMHNGRMAGFRQVRRSLTATLSDESYDQIEGTTDSEHAFALFLDRLRPHFADYDLTRLVEALTDVLHTLVGFGAAAGIGEASDYNFAVTDGERVVATRYTDRAGAVPQTLYVCTGRRFENVDGHYRMVDGPTGAVIVASEPLTSRREEWRAVPPNHVVTVDRDLSVTISPLAL